MTISDRIRDLRKAKGVSQEELADSLNISRQAISKWESGQSLPDIEKIVLLSEYFNTTTDYLLKGTKQLENTKHIPAIGAAAVGAVMGTAVNATALILSIALWKEFQREFITGIGLAVMVFGTMLFIMGQIGDPANKMRARKNFLLINVWILSFIPLSCVYNRMLSPIPRLYSPIWHFGLFLCFYIVACITADIMILEKSNGN